MSGNLCQYVYVDCIFILLYPSYVIFVFVSLHYNWTAVQWGCLDWALIGLPPPLPPLWPKLQWVMTALVQRPGPDLQTFFPKEKQKRRLRHLEYSSKNSLQLLWDKPFKQGRRDFQITERGKTKYPPEKKCRRKTKSTSKRNSKRKQSVRCVNPSDTWFERDFPQLRA